MRFTKENFQKKNELRRSWRILGETLEQYRCDLMKERRKKWWRVLGS